MTARPDIVGQEAEARARAAYDACHPDDSFEDLKRRAAFSKEDRLLLRDWLSAAAQDAVAARQPAAPAL